MENKQKKSILQRLHEMEIHEGMIVYNDERLIISCMRVPGGFIYEYKEFNNLVQDHLLIEAIFVPEPKPAIMYSDIKKEDINLDEFL